VRVVAGPRVIVGGNIYYLPVYVEVDNYSSWDVVISHNMAEVAGSPTGASQLKIYENPTGTNIGSFSAADVVSNDFTNTFSRNVNIAGSLCFGAPGYSDCQSSWPSVTASTQHWVDDGATADTAGYATIGVTRSAAAVNNSYIGLTKAGIVAWGIGVGTSPTNNLIFGPASASPAKTIPTPYLSIAATGGVTVPTGNLSVTNGGLTVGGTVLATNQPVSAMSFGASSGANINFTTTEPFTFIAPRLINAGYNPLSIAQDSGLFYNDTSGFVVGPWSNSSEGIRIGATGNVGIGQQPNGLWKLQVAGATVADMFIDRDNSQRYVDPSGTSVIEKIHVNNLKNQIASIDETSNNWNWTRVVNSSYAPGPGSRTNGWNIVPLDPNKRVLALLIQGWSDDGGACFANIPGYVTIYTGQNMWMTDLDLNYWNLNVATDALSCTNGDNNFTPYGFALDAYPGTINFNQNGGAHACNGGYHPRFGYNKPMGLSSIPAGQQLAWLSFYTDGGGAYGVNCYIDVLYADES